MSNLSDKGLAAITLVTILIIFVALVFGFGLGKEQVAEYCDRNVAFIAKGKVYECWERKP